MDMQHPTPPPITVATERGAIEVEAADGLIHMTSPTGEILLDKHQADELIFALAEALSR